MLGRRHWINEYVTLWFSKNTRYCVYYELINKFSYVDWKNKKNFTSDTTIRLIDLNIFFSFKIKKNFKSNEIELSMIWII